jgi:hypothetical protein
MMELTHFDGYAMLDAIEFGAQWGRNQAMAEIQAQSMALAHGCPKESVTEGLEIAAHRCYEPNDKFMEGFKKGAKWQQGKDKEEWLEKALDFFGSNYNSLVDGGVFGVFDDKKKMIEEFVEFMKNDNL